MRKISSSFWKYYLITPTPCMLYGNVNLDYGKTKSSVWFMSGGHNLVCLWRFLHPTAVKALEDGVGVSVLFTTYS